MVDPDECTHPVQFGGMCAVCAKQLDTDADESTSLSVMHSSASVKVSAEEAHRLDSETTSHLLSQRKLALIVDLDQTIIHATVDPTVGEWMKDENNPNYEALKSVGKFRLGIDGEEIGDDDNDSVSASRACWYYVKPRPGLPEFLKKLSEKYQMHVYTMGTRSYANCVCKLVDPDGSIFGSRILSRDESGSMVRKSLSRLFPVDHSMVVIIDDREDVWSRSPNLLPVLPYEFFVGIGDINATFLPAIPTPPLAQPVATSSSAADKLGQQASSAEHSDSDSSSTPLSSSDPGAITGAGSSKSTTPGEEDGDEDSKAAHEAAALLVLQSEKLQSKLVEQREARPLAKMQEALNEKLGKQNGSITPSGTSTPNGDADESEGTPNLEQASSALESNAKDDQRDAASNGPAQVAGDTTSNSKTESTVDSSPPLGPPPPPPSHQPQAAVLRDTDEELQRIHSILDNLHSEWYTKYDQMQAHPKPQDAKDPTIQKPSVVDILSEKKSHVLEGCNIVFSSMIPIGEAAEKSQLWVTAREFGAIPSNEIEEGVTTHVVAARLGTAKVNRAHKMSSLEVVWPSWFYVSTSRWQRQPELFYRMKAPDNLDALIEAEETATGDTTAETSATTTDVSGSLDEAGSMPEDGSAKTQPDEGGEEGGATFDNELNEMDWGAAADEVDAYLDDATTASNTSSPSPSSLTGMDDEVDDPVESMPLSSEASKKRIRTDEDSNDVHATDFAQTDRDSTTAAKKRKADSLQHPLSESNNVTSNDTTETNSVDDSFLDDLAEELDGQLDNE